MREDLRHANIAYIKSERDRIILIVVGETGREARPPIGKPLPIHRTPPWVATAQSRIAIASASLSSAGRNPRARTAERTACLSALPLPLMTRLIVPTGTPS